MRSEMSCTSKSADDDSRSFAQDSAKSGHREPNTETNSNSSNLLSLLCTTNHWNYNRTKPNINVIVLINIVAKTGSQTLIQ